MTSLFNKARSKSLGVVAITSGAKEKKEKENKEKPPKVAAKEILKDCEKYGVMKKQGGSVKTWHKRFMVLHQGKLYYFKSKADAAPKGMITIAGLRCERAENNESKEWIIRIISPARTYYTICETESDMNDWIKSINEAAATSSSQLTHVVANETCEDKDAKFKTIQTALAAPEASNSDQIAIRPGVYSLDKESVNVSLNVEIRGVSVDRTVLQLQGDLKVPAIVIAAKGTVRLAHLTLSNTAEAIFVKSGNLIVEQCSITSTEGSAIRVANGCSLTVINSVFSHNSQHAIVVQDNATAHFIKCTFDGNKQSSVHIINDAACTIENCIFRKTSEQSYITVETTKNVVVKGCVFHKNDKGAVKIKESCTAEMTNNEFL